MQTTIKGIYSLWAFKVFGVSGSRGLRFGGVGVLGLGYGDYRV